MKDYSRNSLSKNLTCKTNQLKLIHNLNQFIIMKPILFVLSAVLVLASSAFEKQLTQYVNPFLGTAPLHDSIDVGYNPPKHWRVWTGLTYPAASLPNAMIQLSPITEWNSGAGYE